MIAIDVSESMNANGKFDAAKRAAQIFLDTAPDDLYVGIVTFAGNVYRGAGAVPGPGGVGARRPTAWRCLAGPCCTTESCVR